MHFDTVKPELPLRGSYIYIYIRVIASAFFGLQTSRGVTAEDLLNMIIYRRMLGCPSFRYFIRRVALVAAWAVPARRWDVATIPAASSPSRFHDCLLA